MQPRTEGLWAMRLCVSLSPEGARPLKALESIIPEVHIFRTILQCDLNPEF